MTVIIIFLPAWSGLIKLVSVLHLCTRFSAHRQKNYTIRKITDGVYVTVFISVYMTVIPARTEKEGFGNVGKTVKV